MEALTSALLYLNGVTVSFDGFRALNNLSFAIEPGEMRAIIGPNGAGKTTMMDVVTGKTRPDEGDVYFEGLHDLTKLSVVARRIPWVPEDVEWLLVAKRAMLASLNPAVIRAARAPRAILIGKHTDDLRFVVDYAPDLGPEG